MEETPVAIKGMRTDLPVGQIYETRKKAADQLRYANTKHFGRGMLLDSARSGKARAVYRCRAAFLRTGVDRVGRKSGKVGKWKGDAYCDGDLGDQAALPQYPGESATAYGRRRVIHGEAQCAATDVCPFKAILKKNSTGDWGFSTFERLKQVAAL